MCQHRLQWHARWRNLQRTLRFIKLVKDDGSPLGAQSESVIPVIRMAQISCNDSDECIWVLGGGSSPSAVANASGNFHFDPQNSSMPCSCAQVMLVGMTHYAEDINSFAVVRDPDSLDDAMVFLPDPDQQADLGTIRCTYLESGGAHMPQITGCVYVAPTGQ